VNAESRHLERAARLRRVSLETSGGRIAIALVLLALLLGVAWWFSRPVLFGDLQAWQHCEAQYARAGTATESLAVDAQRPVLTRTQAAVGVSCGVLRQRMPTGR
jgi:hypothetical protein